MQNFWQKLNKPILALAPMAGITDSAFRTMCRRHGADVVYSEMASVSALFFKPQKTFELIRFNEEEHPYIVQLFGNKPEHFAKATQILNSLPSPSIPLFQRGKLSRPDGIDINFGCPAKKVFGHGSGCALMPQKELAREIISAVCDNTDLPVSIKIRAGVKGMTAMEFLENTHDLPYCAVMIHGRTYEGGFSGPIDFAIISEIKNKFPEKIILANGGINSAEDAKNILEGFPNLDGLGIARGAWGRPYIFDEIKNAISNSPRRDAIHRVSVSVCPQDAMNGVSTNIDYDFSKIKTLMLEHANLIYEDKKELGMLEIRKHLAWYVRRFPGASELRKKLVVAKSVEEIEKILQ